MAGVNHLHSDEPQPNLRRRRSRQQLAKGAASVEYLALTMVARGRGAPAMVRRGAPTSGSCRGTGTLTRGHPLSLVVGAAMPRRRIRRRRRAAPR